MSDNNEQNLLSNVRLCDAIKWHPCLYDPKSKVYQMKHAVDAAWQSIANECEDTVAHCKLRWRIIRKSFLRSFRKNVPYNRYYLNDYLDFLRPHLPSLEMNEALATKAEDYDTIQLEDQDDTETDNEQRELEQANEDQNAENDDRNERKASIINEEEIEEFELNEELLEEPEDEDSDTASAEETLRATRVGRPKGKSSTMSTPDLEDGEEDETSTRGDNASETSRAGRRMARTRKANSRYMEYDIYDGRYKKDSKPEDKRKAEKRPFEPVKIEKTEIKQEEKRTRRSVENVKMSTAGPSHKMAAPNMVREETTKTKLLPKKLEVKLVKPKNLELMQAQTSAAASLPPPAAESKPASKEVITVRKFGVKIDKSLADIVRSNKPKMVDNSTNSLITSTVDRGTQYEVDQARTVDDDFVDSLKPQMAIMNSRQKFNFKKKVFQALMDVFDDASNFTHKSEHIELPATGAPRFDQTTTGELRLMRELVSLITAAKATPEIMEAKEKVTKPQDEVYEDLNISPTKPTTKHPEKSPTTSTALVPSTSQSGAMKRGDSLGLPRHILQKVVKVAGSNGGTILAHEGDKRRVYRIYPKGTVPPGVTNNTAATSTSTTIGTFYVTPPKVQMAGGSVMNTVVRSTHVGNTVNGKPITFTTITKPGSQSATAPIQSALTKKSTTTTTSTSETNLNNNSQVVITRQRVSLRPQATAKNSPLQNKVVTSTNAAPPSAGTHETPTSSNCYPVQRFLATSGDSNSKSGTTQIQISQAVSLNAAAKRPNNIRTFLNSGHDSDTFEGNSGDSSIFPDNPPTEDGADDVATQVNKMLANADIKNEPMD